LIPDAAPPVGLTTVMRQPVKVAPAVSGGSVLLELIAGRVLTRMVSSESVASPRPPPPMPICPAGQKTS
jgi:hypothetical protein